ncbi:MAG: protein-glutamate O-methyltransferase CheR [Planctomycetota bacterium]
MTPTPDDINAICGLVDDLCGIALDESKSYLIEGRLADLASRHGCESYAELARRARAATGRQIKSDIVDAITTNETLWFRDSSPFEALRYKLLPEMIDAKAGTPTPKKFRIWSAACSTGQEAYSIAMAFGDIVPNLADWDLEIFGSDISPAAVEKAKRGAYSDLELSRGLEQKYRGAYFVRQGREWQVNPLLRSKCRFEVRNLLEPLTGVGKFDIAFCRNVAIYFKPADRKRFFEQIAAQLNPGGWLFAGSSESRIDLGPKWTPHRHCRAVCYQPTPALAARR